MAHHTSAKTRIRRNARRFVVNHARKARIRTFVKKVEQAIAAGHKEEADAAFRNAAPEVMRGVTKGVLHRNTAARKLSRLNARLKRLTV